MTPQQRAQMIYNKLVVHIQRYDEYVDDRSKFNAKQCALIAVDEIINSNPYKLSLEGKFLTEHITYDINFWEEVKKEIEKL
jgi:hypothetical protein